MNRWFVGAISTAALLLLFMAITTAQEKEEKTLDEGEWLSLEGQLTKAGDRPAFKVTDGDHKGKTFVLLENSKLEELEKWTKESKPEKVEMSCDVMKYKNKNFLVVSSFVKGEEEEEEEEEEEDK